MTKPLKYLSFILLPTLLAGLTACGGGGSGGNNDSTTSLYLTVTGCSGYYQIAFSTSYEGNPYFIEALSNTPGYLTQNLPLGVPLVLTTETAIPNGSSPPIPAPTCNGTLMSYASITPSTVTLVGSSQPVDITIALVPLTTNHPLASKQLKWSNTSPSFQSTVNTNKNDTWNNYQFK